MAKRLIYGLSAIILCLGMAYIWTGRTLAPFHGDEADQIAKSYDFVTIFVQHDPTTLQVTPPVAIHSPEHIRILTGTTTIYLSGLIFWLNEPTAYGYASPWYYGADYEWNVIHGNRPQPATLFRGRIPTTLLTMFSIPFFFWITWHSTHGHPYQRLSLALIATALLTTHPVWLLNGRRLMQEAALGTTTLALIWLGLRWQQNPTSIRLIGITLIAGFCLAAKLTAFLPVGLVYLALGIHRLPKRNLREKIIHLSGLSLSGLGSIGLFFLLTPALWEAPIARWQLAIQLRHDVLQGQTAASAEAYDHFYEPWAALLIQPFLSEVQYFESDDFQGVLDAEIYRYESSPVGGWQMPAWIGVFWTVSAILGFAYLIHHRHQPEIRLILIWVVGTGFTLGFTVPLAWQRYYLPWTMPFCLMAGLGLQISLDWLQHIKGTRV